MTDKIELTKCYQVIFEALESGHRSEQVVQIISENMGIPVVVLDPCGSILAQAYESLYDPDQEHLDENKEIWVHMIETYYAGDQTAGKDTIVSQTDPSGNMHIVMSAILVGDNMEGFCITYHGKDSSGADAGEINRLICRALSMSAGWRHPVYSSNESTIKQAVSKILLGKYEDARHVPQISEDIYDTYAGGQLVLGLIQAQKQSGKSVQQLRSQISDQFSDILTYIQDKELLILFAHMDADRQQTVCEKVGAIIENTGFLCGISEIFCSREQIETKKKILSRIIRIGRKSDRERQIFTEYQYYLELVCSYAYEEIGDQVYCCRELERLAMEDREKGTEFYRTLKEYLLSGNSVNVAAKKLFVHRNTMVYRLSKIHEIMKLDINNPEVAKRLLVSIILRSFSLQENR